MPYKVALKALHANAYTSHDKMDICLYLSVRPSY